MERLKAAQFGTTSAGTSRIAYTLQGAYQSKFAVSSALQRCVVAISPVYIARFSFADWPFSVRFIMTTSEGDKFRHPISTNGQKRSSLSEPANLVHTRRSLARSRKPRMTAYSPVRVPAWPQKSAEGRRGSVRMGSRRRARLGSRRAMLWVYRATLPCLGALRWLLSRALDSGWKVRCIGEQRTISALFGLV